MNGADTESNIEERLKNLIFQLHIECGVFDRMIYKNKNQHRRCSYFQWLLKVKRELKLLHSAHIEELVDSCFHVITGRKSKRKVHLLESLKKRNCETGRYNFMERLLGATRLLSQMVEPILKAASEISILFARSFFREFTLTIMALLGRLRVLVQQMFLDIILLYNEVSSIAQKKQLIKITQDGVEVFREYYPNMETIIILDCVWKSDKFVLVEELRTCNSEHPNEPLEGGEPVRKPSVRYKSVASFLGEDELDTEDEENPEADANPDQRKEADTPSNPDDGLGSSAHGEDLIEGSISSTSSLLSACSVKSKSASLKKVAFISVKKPEISAAAPVTESMVGVSENKGKNEDKKDPFLSLLTGGNLNDRLFDID